MSLSAGSRLGPYEILSPLGAGGMGEVYRARDSRLSRDVAIKVLPAALANDSDRVERFRVEAKAAGSLNHPNILAVYDTGNDNGLSFVVSELLEGRTLRDAIATGRLGERKAIGYAIQIAHGLAAAHARGVIHRDLKPENIFITNDGQVKILDFGLAKLTTAAAGGGATQTIATSPGVVMGTAGYMAPEQLRGTVVDTHADVFSFGAVLYEMLSGRKAFDGVTAADSASAILKEEPRELNEVTPALNRIVLRCIEKEPTDRFDSSRDLAFALEAVSGSNVTGKYGNVEKARKRIPTTWMVALAGAAAFAAGIWFVTGKSAPPTPVYKRISFGRGVVTSARFTPEHNAVVYSAMWNDAPEELFSVRVDQPEARSLGIKGSQVVSISPGGDMALIQRPLDTALELVPGVLSRAPLSGGAPRDILKDVIHADHSPSGDLAVARRVNERIRIEFPPGRNIYESANTIGWLRVRPEGGMVALAERPFGMGSRWTLFTLDANGKRNDLARNLEGEAISFAWSSSETLLLQMGSVAGGELKSISLNGKISVVHRFPISTDILDIAKDGRILVRRTLWRASITGSSRARATDRDLSWMDASEVDAITPDGKLLLTSEFGEGGGPDRWSVYLRKLDGSPAVRLSEGGALALSPDRQFALTMRRGDPPRLVLIPTGAGDAREIAGGNFTDYTAATFMPDGKQIVICGTHKTLGRRMFTQNIETGEIRPVTPVDAYTGLGWHALAPDGKSLVASGPDRRLRLYSIVNPSLERHPEPIPGLVEGDRAMRWLADGQAFYMSRSVRAHAQVFVVNPHNGQTRLWKEWDLADPAGVDNIYAVQIASDDDTFFYTYVRRFTDLYVVDGLRVD